MRRLLRRFIRAAAFVGKEINEVRRQPRLVLSLILGPFLILLLFGIGYQGEASKLSGIIVIPKEGNYSHSVEEYQKLVGGQLEVRGLTTDQNEAIRFLNNRQIDLVVVVPTDVAKQVSAGAQVKVPILFNEVDPMRQNWVTYLTYIYINELNKRTVAAAASQGQQNAGDLRSGLARMRNALSAAEKNLDRGEVQEANKQVHDLQGSSSNVQMAVVLMGGLLASNDNLITPAQPQNPDQVNLAKGQDVSARLATNIRSLNDELNSSNPDRARTKERISQVRSDLDELDKLTQQFQSINPLVLAAPFYADVKNQAPVQSSVTAFYAPGVLVLLLQHIAVTLAALSMVRERLLGTVELFRVSPVSPSEIMSGKYISFTLLLGIISVVLLGLISNNLNVGGIPLSLGVPMLGDWGLLALTLALVVIASIGLGFLISVVSKSESQAVQLAMLVLLTSVFFSGFFLRLETLWEPVRAVSYALPVTYGVSALQTIMLRGGQPENTLMLGLGAAALIYGALASFFFARSFKRG
ncbi:MAG TPA: ABC transporter permease [Chloroflexia bacterium]|nr:ABC transporter permease [Chloroflexia bacterium]